MVELPFPLFRILADSTAGLDTADKALHQTAAFAGFSSYALMVGTVVWGVLTATNLVQRSVRRETLYGGHMTMAIAAICFAVVHVAGNVFRPLAHISLANALVPWLGTATAVATGVVSIELAVVTAVSVWFQRRLGYRTWQTVHYLGYPTYGFAIIHTVMAGSDVRIPLIEIALGVSVVLVAVICLLRVLPSSSLVRERLSMDYR